MRWSRWDPYNLFALGPPWSVQVIIQGGNWMGFGGMQCLASPLVPLPPDDSKPLPARVSNTYGSCSEGL